MGKANGPHTVMHQLQIRKGLSCVEFKLKTLDQEQDRSAVIINMVRQNIRNYVDVVFPLYYQIYMHAAAFSYFPNSEYDLSLLFFLILALLYDVPDQL